MGFIPHNRRSIRLRGYDYRNPGAYFITLCIKNRECLFGEIRNGEMVLNEFGDVVTNEWLRTPVVRPEITLDSFVVMPNHLHGIIVIHPGRGGSRTAPTTVESTKPLGRLIGAFKTTSTKRINMIRGTPGIALWQRNYYEHIVRGEFDLFRIRKYIAANPAKWERNLNTPLF